MAQLNNPPMTCDMSMQHAKAAFEFTEGLVSIVIAAYNAESFLAETLESVFSQGYERIEVVVVDDGSTDRTSEIVERFTGRLRYVKQQNSGGGSRPRNVGARLATGEFLSFFDADDVMTADRIARQVAFLRDHPAAIAVATDYRNFSEGSDSRETHFDTCTALRTLLGQASPGSLLLTADQTRDLLLIENFGITGAVMYRRSAFVAAAGFDESLRIGEDLELLYRVAEYGSVGVLDVVSFRRRWHGNNISASEEFGLREKIRSRAKLLSIEMSGRRAAALQARLADYYLGLADMVVRRSPAEALSHARSAVRYGFPRFSSRTAKLAAKIALSLAGLRN